MPASFITRNRNFTFLWTAQLVASASASSAALAASIYAFAVTGSSLSVGLSLLASALPSLLFGLVAGVYVDRWRRKRVMAGAVLALAALYAAVPLLLPLGLAWLYLLLGLAALATQLMNPAYASLLPDVASERELAAAHSFLEVSSYGAYVAGFAVAGIVSSRESPAAAFLASALGCLVAAGLVAQVAARPRSAATERMSSVQAIWTNLRVGFHTVRSTQILRSLFLLFALGFLLIGVGDTLMLPFAANYLGASGAEYGLLETMQIIGFGLGSVGVAYLGRRLRDGQWIAMAWLGMGIAGVAFALTSAIGPALILHGLFGALNTPSVVARSRLIQDNTRHEVRGRVLSAFSVMRDAAFLVGMALAGLADVVGARAVLVVVEAGIVGVGLLAVVIPGLGQTTAEWRRTVAMLRHAPTLPDLPPGRPATLADFDLLAARQPALAALSMEMRKRAIRGTAVRAAPAGSLILRIGEASDAAYFIVEGRAAAGIDEDGHARILEVMSPGDFFGEIAALTGVPRTANVVAETDCVLWEVPARELRALDADPQLHRLLEATMTTRLARTNLVDAARLAGLNQDALLDLRTPQPEPATE